MLLRAPQTLGVPVWFPLRTHIKLNMPYRWVTSVGHGSLGQSLGSNVSDGCSDNGSYSFTGSAGEAIVSKTAAYLVTDSRYWEQAHQELDANHWVPIFA